MINMDIMNEFEWAKFNIMEDTFDALVKVVNGAEYKTYDYRASMKAFKRLQNLKNNYGAIKDFADYLFNISRYFTIRENAEILKTISRRLNRFAENYMMLL